MVQDIQGIRPRRNPDVAEKIGSTTILFDANAGRLYELNETARAMWVLCDGTRTVEEISGAIGAEYDAPPKKLLEDTSAFVGKMLELNLLIK